MARDLLESLVGYSVLVDEGINFATYGLLVGLDLQHLELSPAIRMGIDNGRGQISGFETVRDYAGPQYHGRVILGKELRDYFVHRTQAKRVIHYDINEALSKHLSKNEREIIETIFEVK